jgi:hypothetical protein
MVFFITTAVRTSNPTCNEEVHIVWDPLPGKLETKVLWTLGPLKKKKNPSGMYIQQLKTFIYI